MKNYNLNRKNYKKAAALTEFVIMTTVMIPLLLYVSFFSELLQFRMKINEMGYFAAWELSAHGLSNYSNGTTNGGAYNDIDGGAMVFKNATDKVKSKTYELYHNLDSADPSRAIGYIMITPDPDSLDVKMEMKNNIIPNDTLNGTDSTAGGAQGNGSANSGGQNFGTILTKVSNFINKGINFVAGKAFGFNTKGIGSKVTASGGFEISSHFNSDAGSRDSGGFSNHKLLQDSMLSGLTTYTAKPFTVWVDTWAVKSGADVDNTGTGKKCINTWGKFNCDGGISPYAMQVSRMSLIGTWSGGRVLRVVVNAIGSGFLDILGQIPLIGSMFGAEEHPAEARMVSKNYYYKTDKNQYKYGNHVVSISKGQYRFQTSPLVYIFRSGATPTEKGIVEYKQTLDKRRNFYMGNNKPNCKFNGITEQCQ